MHQIRITHARSGEVIAEGPVGLLGITPIEGNYYIGRRCLRTKRFRPYTNSFMSGSTMRLKMD